MKKQLNIALFGLPGAGKGLQSKKLINNYGLSHLSIGKLFRENIEKQTALGKDIQKYVNNGLLVPDDIVLSIINNYLYKNVNNNGIILDGFPRNIFQARELDKKLSEHGTELHMLIVIDVPQEEIINRIKVRRQVSHRPDDQDNTKVLNRIKLYHKEAPDVIEHYASLNKLFKVSGTGPVESVFNSLKNIIDKF